MDAFSAPYAVVDRHNLAGDVILSDVEVAAKGSCIRQTERNDTE